MHRPRNPHYFLEGRPALPRRLVVRIDVLMIDRVGKVAHCNFRWEALVWQLVADSRYVILSSLKSGCDESALT